MEQGQNVNIKISDEILKGVFSNMMMVTHTNEEFVLDFINMFPPSGIVNARVVVSPGHAKRIAQALAENVKKYENAFGQIKQETGPPAPAAPSSTGEKNYGFEVSQKEK